MNASYRPTRLEIDLQAVARNVRILRGRIPQTTKLMAVVKADAYGHGAVPVAETALQNGAECLAVALVEEGVQLRQSGISAPVLVLGGIAREGAQAVAAYGLIQTVFDVETVRWLEEAAAREGTAVDVHLKVDTGMGRIGVRSEAEARAVAEAALASDHVRLSGVFTHFATSDGEDLGFAREQNARFVSLVSALKALRPDLTVHAANSAAILRVPEAHYDLVRAGIALYVAPDLPDGAGDGLSDAMRWVTRAVHVKDVEPGETVSYGRIFTARRPTRVMTLPVGYADGYHRAIGGRGRALVRGQSAPVIGRVCMDQCMLDVTGIDGARAGDEVVLLGAQGRERITAREMGTWCGMIDYEIVLSPTARVPRIYR